MRKVRAHAVVSRSRARRRGQYAEYMASPAWWRRRADWFSQEEHMTGAPARCAVCGGADGLDLHHLTYDRLGREHHGDLVSVCRDHHDELHRAYESGRWRGLEYGAVMRRLLRLAQQREQATR